LAVYCGNYVHGKPPADASRDASAAEVIKQMDGDRSELVVVEHVAAITQL